MTERPKLYPGHQHQWAELSEWTEDLTSACPPSMVRCTVCGFQAPRNAAGLDGRMVEHHTCPVCQKALASHAAACPVPVLGGPPGWADPRSQPDQESL